MNESTDLQEKWDLGGLEAQRLSSNCHCLKWGKFCKVKPKKSKLLSINRERTSKKVVNEDLASVSRQVRASTKLQDGQQEHVQKRKPLQPTISVPEQQMN